MRALLFVVLSAIAALGEEPASPVQVPANLSIPAQLSKTVDTKKCKAGDAFEMRTLEPVLIGKGIVMPENTKLNGRVLGSGSRQNDKPSWVVLVIESARWKKNSVPLHAFVMSQITTRTPPATSSGYNVDASQTDTLRPRRLSRGAPQLNPRDDIAMTSSRNAQDNPLTTRDIAPASYRPLNDVRIMKAKNGTVFLLSQKPHLKLPSGTMLMLRQQAVPVSSASTADATASTQESKPGAHD